MHWSRSSMALRSGLSKSTIRRVWRKSGLRPPFTGTLRLSADPLLVEKVVDVVGMYDYPPDKAALPVGEIAELRRRSDSLAPASYLQNPAINHKER
jgi:hypothetical protein